MILSQTPTMTNLREDTVPHLTTPQTHIVAQSQTHACTLANAHTRECPGTPAHAQVHSAPHFANLVPGRASPAAPGRGCRVENNLTKRPGRSEEAEAGHPRGAVRRGPLPVTDPCPPPLPPAIQGSGAGKTFARPRKPILRTRDFPAPETRNSFKVSRSPWVLRTRRCRRSRTRRGCGAVSALRAHRLGRLHLAGPAGLRFPRRATTLSSQSSRLRGPPPRALIGRGGRPSPVNLRCPGRGRGRGLRRPAPPSPRTRARTAPGRRRCGVRAGAGRARWSPPGASPLPGGRAPTGPELGLEKTPARPPAGSDRAGSSAAAPGTRVLARGALSRRPPCAAPPSPAERPTPRRAGFERRWMSLRPASLSPGRAAP